MNELQKQKAIEALERKKAKERIQCHAMIYHFLAYADIHFNGVLLPYRILYDLHKVEHEGAFKEILPNSYYPNPAITLKTKYSEPHYTGDYKDLKLANDGFPIFTSNAEYRQRHEEYQKRIEAEKTPIDKWGYYYARFLLPYDIEKFSDFDFWGEVPKTEEEREVINNLKAACMEVQADCRENPQDYNTEPVLRKEEHKNIYDVPYGYI
jgi:hypothetical protein